MSTLYDLFKVSENATQEEIKESYNKIIKNANSLPQNEEIIDRVRRIKIAYGILSNEEKRKKYDFDLASKKTDELLKNVKIKQQEIQNEIIESQDINKEKIEISEYDENRLKEQIKMQIDLIAQRQEEEQRQMEETLKQQKVKEKNYKKQLRKDKRETQKKQQLRREMEIEAYGRFLENQGYKVKYPWTWPRVKRLIISMIGVIIVGVVLWNIPFFRKSLIDLYNGNFLIKTIVDICVSIFDSIIEMIQNIFK